MREEAVFEVEVPDDFWRTLKRLKGFYTKTEMIEIIEDIKECISELEVSGAVAAAGWSDHALIRPPFNDGLHREFHVHDDDTLVVCIIRRSAYRIRMVGVYRHATIPKV